MNKIYKEYLQNGVIDEDNAVDIIEEQQKEIERLKKQSNNYAKRIIKAIDLLEEARENIDLPWYDRQHLIEKTINELKGEGNE